MSEYHIPFHVQEEIMRRLPVKSLIRLRCVSKAWKSFIDSSEFITAHSLRHHTQQQHLLVLYADSDEEMKYVSYIDDDTFPQHKSLLTLPPPLFAKQIIHPKVVGSSRGLVCFYGWDPTTKTYTTLLWNPSIRNSAVVVVPTKPSGVGFGVCPATNDPKIVLITQSSWNKPDIETKVFVYTLSLGKWRSLSCNLPIERIHISRSQSPVVTDRFIYWIAHMKPKMIMSFDVTNEIFQVIDLPDSFASHPYTRLSISKLRESLVVLKYKYYHSDCSVWMMEDGVQGSFTKLYTIMKPHDNIVVFRKSGEPIMVVTDDDDDEVPKLVLYESDSAVDNVLEISPSCYSFIVKSYTETLLLLGRSDCSSY